MYPIDTNKIVLYNLHIIFVALKAMQNNLILNLDYFFLKLKQNDCENIISEYGDMDTQSTLVKEFIKRGLIFKIMPKFLFKKIINIFGFR